MRRIFLAASVLLVAAACGSQPSGGSAAPEATRQPDVATLAPNPDPASDGTASDGTVSNGTASDGTAPTPGASPSPVTPKGGTVDPHKVPWTKAEPAEDGRTIRVEWSSGVEPCTTLDRVDVAETGKKVTITLYEGPLRASPDAVCVQIAITKVTEVRLDKPLGDRRIVDGAR